MSLYVSNNSCRFENKFALLVRSVWNWRWFTIYLKFPILLVTLKLMNLETGLHLKWNRLELLLHSSHLALVNMTLLMIFELFPGKITNLKLSFSPSFFLEISLYFYITYFHFSYISFIESPSGWYSSFSFLLAWNARI